MTPTGDEEIALLSRRIDDSGLSVRQFAREVLLREERTVQRWLAGDNPIPRLVVEWLENPIPHSWPKGTK